MKKILFFLYAFSLSLFISFNSSAVTASELADYMVDSANDFFGFGLSYDVNSVTQIAQYWIDNPTAKMYIANASNNINGVYFYVGDIYMEIETRYHFNSGARASLYSNNSGSYNTTTTNVTLINGLYCGILEDYYNTVDYSNQVYDPLIYSPNFNILNKTHSGTENIDLVYQKLTDDNIYNRDIEIHTYIKMYLYSPKSVLVDYGKFTVNSYYKSNPIIIQDYGENNFGTGNQLDLNTYKSDSQTFLSYVLNNSDINFVNGMSAGMQSSRTLDYVNSISTGYPHFVNGVEIWAQNYYILDDVVYVSKWVQWNSKRYSDYSEVVPVAQDQPAEGILTTETPSAAENQNVDDSDTYNPVGVDTGDNQNIIVNNNYTPNYPDYPTVASYNHDNMLLQYIQTAAYIPSMFSGYSSFLTDAFGFIPPQIWTIIGFGFLGCIAIMIIKIL